MIKQKFKPAEIKSALASFCMTQEILTEHVNMVLDSDYSTSYITKIVNRKRSNRTIERVIWDLLGDWVTEFRKIPTEAIEFNQTAMNKQKSN